MTNWKFKVKKILSQLVYYLRLTNLASFFLKHKIYIINYHSVARPNDTNHCYDNLIIDPQLFEQQLVYLKKRGHTFVNFSDLLSLSTNQSLAINKPTIIYFDDGFADLSSNALLLIEKYGAKATIFICPELASGENILWTIKYRQFLLSQNKPKREIEVLIKEAKKMPESERQKMLVDLYDQNNFEFKGNNLFLTWQQIKDLCGRYKIEIGSHGLSHCQLANCSMDDLSSEVSGSKKIIEENLGLSVVAFSYPYGRYDEKVLTQVDLAGYNFAVSGGQGLNSLSDLSNNKLKLKNIPARITDDLAMFSFRLYFSNLFKK